MSNFNNVFISYGRAESKAFAAKLHSDLCERGYTVWFDQNDIPLGVDFQNQIDEGIEKADVFIFIIAPHAVRSVYCRKEIDLAIKRGKRIVPILHIEPTDDQTWQQLHPAIGKINWVYMRQEWQKDIPQEDYKTIDNYEEAFEGLWNLVEKNKEYVRKHTEILDKALNWENHNKDSHLLLVGKERQEAEKWLLKEFQNEQAPCFPSELHTDFLCESRKNAENLLTDCFISYSSQDKEEREAVRLALARHLITTWTHNKDIIKGEEFDKAIERGIEEADNFLFFITEDSIVSEYCLFELEYAVKLNKKIIPLLIEKVPSKEFPSHIKNLQYIDFTDNVITEVSSKNEKTDFEKDIDTLLEEIKRNQEHYTKHKVFLTNALKWERQNKNTSVLLRGHKLDEAKVWLKRGQKLSKHQPLPLHENFILESEAKSGNLETEIFVSYSRTDSDFARKLNEEFQFNGKTTWFDQESIASGADFQQEIYRGIEGATNFLFVISPDAIQSPYCADEVEYAQKLGKRFITVLHRETDPSTLPAALAAVQWIDFVDKDFNKQFGELVRTLDTDREHVRTHNKWQKEALQWENHNKGSDYLLRGSSFVLAKEWLESADKEDKKPEPTALQREYLKESDTAIFALQRKEKRTIQRLRGLLVVAAIALIGAFVAGFFMYEAQKEAKTALKQAKKESRANERIATALRIEATDPTLAFYLVTKAYEDNKSKPIKNILNEMYYKHFFYEERTQNDKEKEIYRNSYLRDTVISSDGKFYAIKSTTRRFEEESEPSEIKIFSKEEELLTTFLTTKVLSGIELSVDNKKLIGIVTEEPSHESKKISEIYTYDIQTGKMINSLVVEMYIKQVKLPSDGKIILVGYNTLCFLDEKLKLQGLYPCSNPSEKTFSIHPSDTLLLTGNWSDKTIKLWNMKKPNNPILAIPVMSVSCVKFSPNGSYIFSGREDGVIQQWDLAGNLMQTFKGHTSRIANITFTDDQMISYSQDIQIKWQKQGNLLETKELGIKEESEGFYMKEARNYTIEQNNKDENLLVFNLHYLAVHDKDGFLINNYPNQETVGLYIGDALFSSNGEKIFIANSNEVEVWNSTLSQKERIITLGNEIGIVYNIDISKNNKYLAAMVSYENKKNAVVVYDIENNDKQIFKKIIGEEDNFSRQLFFYGDKIDQLLFTNERGKVQTWNIKTNKIESDLSEITDKPIVFVKIYDNNNVLLVNNEGKAIIVDKDSKIKYSLDSAVSIGYHNSKINAELLFNSSLLASSKQQSIRILDLEGNEVKMLNGYKNDMTGIKVSKDGTRIYSIDHYGNLIYWSISTSMINRELIYQPNAEQIKELGLEQVDEKE